jgi:hypothetical protein
MKSKENIYDECIQNIDILIGEYRENKIDGEEVVNLINDVIDETDQEILNRNINLYRLYKP